MRKVVIKNLLKWTLVIVVGGLASCRSGPINLFKSASPHQAYRQKLVNAGLDKTALGADWINNAEKSLRNALDIKIPYKETGYFAAERIPVSTYRFYATKGQKLRVAFNRIPAEKFKLYLDIWEQSSDKADHLLASADTLGNPLELDVKVTGSYLIRLQPELLQSGQYTIEITTGPSLGFPVKSAGKSAVQSFFGDGRDANTRKHEGIDIFAPFRTPVVAIAEGTISRVNENNLGGKVVWMRPAGKDYTLYYAHLDEQIATEGQRVAPGDTLGLMGNTGNAKHTAPHLHFGIYTSTGAIDPYPFVNPVILPTQKITSALSFLNNTVRSVGKAGIYSSAEGGSKALLKQLEAGTVMDVYAANGSWYTVKLPDEKLGFISAKQVVMADKPLRKHRITSPSENVYDQPDSLAAVKFRLPEGKTVAVLGSFQDYYLIADEQQQRGWISQK